jgi:hypothetical protein
MQAGVLVRSRFFGVGHLTSQRCGAPGHYPASRFERHQPGALAEAAFECPASDESPIPAGRVAVDRSAAVNSK